LSHEVFQVQLLEISVLGYGGSLPALL
jgi:hypothetical protein